jgi:hypothetical protein
MRAPEHPIAVAGWYLAARACFTAIGVALGTLMPSGRSAGAIGNVVFVPMFLLGGGGPPRGVMTGASRPDHGQSRPAPGREGGQSERARKSDVPNDVA